MLIKPPRLSPGDVVGIACPASPPRLPETIDACVQAVRDLGFQPRLATHARERSGFLAGSDDARVDDLHELIRDPEVRCIFCLRGGYGSARLLDRLDFDLFRRSPKVLVGYSDLTSLQLALFERSKLVTFHGPTIDAALINAGPDDEVSRRLVTAVTGATSHVCLAIDPSHRAESVVASGVAEGWLCGGNLTVLCSLLGTPWMPLMNGAILFLEDVNEPPFRIDRCLTHLENAGVLSGVAGVALGTFHRCEDPLAGGEWRQTVLEVIRERLGGLGVPVLAGLPFGHVPMNATIPIGTRARLDADAGELRFLESAVS